MIRTPHYTVIAALLAAAAFGAPASAQTQNAAQNAFKNSVAPPPPGWTGPVFKLSRDYPATVPPCDPDTVCKWLKTDVSFTAKFPPPSGNTWVSGNWATYLSQVLAYVRQGQDPQLRNEIGFRPEVNGKTRWFNVPWMAYDPTVGREFVHGTTNERTAYLSDLVKSPDSRVRQNIKAAGLNLLKGATGNCQTMGFETWSVGYYNEWGGMAVGKSIPKSGQPAIASYMGSRMPAGLPFPEGTVVMKILTTTAPPECVPYLRNSPQWQIHRHRYNAATNTYSCEREVQISRVVQVDVAVIDLRSPTRWVYGTYAYDGNSPGDTFWDRLVPLGIQFGADPWTFPAVPKAESQPVQQTVLNPDVKIYEHYGCEGRLAGPVDNAQSSCMSCHGSAFAAPGGALSVMGTNVPPSFGFAGMCTNYSAANAAYFNNIVTPQKYSGGNFPDAMSLDTSLQLEVAFQQYGQFNTAGRPAACTLRK